MADIFTKTKRSQIMTSIKGKNTFPELNVRRALFAKRLRYRIHDKNLPGVPDIVFHKYKAIIFIHGCFWHQHGCKASTLPKTNESFWAKKLRNNFERDNENLKILKAMGWRVRIIWSCELKNKKFLKNEKAVNEIFNWIVNA
ncbi:MAG: DNA mismatch endonuclease Vsr [bacterium]